PKLELLGLHAGQLVLLGVDLEVPAAGDDERRQQHREGVLDARRPGADVAGVEVAEIRQLHGDAPCASSGKFGSSAGAASASPGWVRRTRRVKAKRLPGSSPLASMMLRSVCVSH